MQGVGGELSGEENKEEWDLRRIVDCHQSCNDDGVYKGSGDENDDAIASVSEDASEGGQDEGWEKTDQDDCREGQA